MSLENRLFSAGLWVLNSGTAALEAMAEKFRAALSRRDVAIRDFDLDRAIALVVDMATRVA